MKWGILEKDLKEDVRSSSRVPDRGEEAGQSWGRN